MQGFLELNSHARLAAHGVCDFHRAVNIARRAAHGGLQPFPAQQRAGQHAGEQIARARIMDGQRMKADVYKRQGLRMRKLLLGIDAGTTAFKAALFDEKMNADVYKRQAPA